MLRKFKLSPRTKRWFTGSAVVIAALLIFQNCGDFHTTSLLTLASHKSAQIRSGVTSLPSTTGTRGNSTGSTGGTPAPGSGPTPPPAPPTPTPVPNNPFGVGVAYFVPGDAGATRAANRAAQMALAASLVGNWGHVRVWCAAYSDPASGLDAATECAAGVNAAYANNLVPVVVLFNPYPAGPDDYIDPAVYATDHTPPHKVWKTLAAWYKTYVSQLPRKDGFPLYVEFGNEQNRTDWWVGTTCYFWIRAAEYAEALGQVADAIHSIGDPRIKVLTGALAAWSDSNPVFHGDGTCGAGSQQNLSSADFATAMMNERPDVFGANPKIDGYSTHPYPMLAYGHCTVNVDCPSPANDPTLYAYRAEMKNLGLPTNFPVFVTEMGYDTVSGDANWIASMTIASYPTWLNRNIPYNNVRGVMGYVMSIPGCTYNYVVDGAVQPVYAAVQALRRSSGY